jgi:hypothetical protein
MRHPFQSIPADKRPKVFWPLLVITLFLMVLLNLEGKPMVTQAAPLGIVSYELAGSVSRAQKILASWDQQAQLSAAFSLGLDYVFMLAYSAAIGLACIWTADALRRRGWPLASLGAPLAWGLWLAAAFDAMENIALVVILFGTVQAPWPEVARWCAIFKFSLIFLGLVYAFFGLVVSVVVGARGRNSIP